MISMSLELLWNDYQEYKNIKIYPFLVGDYNLFEDLIPILLFDKNSLGYAEIIKMSYLKFLIYIVPHMVDENGNRYTDVPNKLEKLLKYVLKEQEFRFSVSEKGKIFLCIKNSDDVILLNERDFDNIKKIILIQNAIPIVDNKLHPDLRKELQENMEYLAKKQGYREGDIEDQIIAYKCEMKFTSYEPIKKMTIYQFRKELARLNLIKDYLIYKTAECSGMVTFKEPIPHWLSHISDKPDYSRLLMSKQDFDIKMNQFSRDNN